MARTHDVIEMLDSAQVKVELLLRFLHRHVGTPADRRRAVEALSAELVGQVTAKQLHLYPATKRVLPDGHRLASRLLNEERELMRLLAALCELDSEDPGFDEALARLAQLVRHHRTHEKTNLLPRLQIACSPAMRERLGRRMQWSRRQAPGLPPP